MDLGATICTPRQPLCDECPFAGMCQAKALEQVSNFPVKPVRKERPIEYKAVLILICGDKIHVSKRPSRGLLADLYQFDWLELQADATEKAIRELYPDARIEPLGEVIHDFTHKRWVLAGFRIELAQQPPTGDGTWRDISELEQLAFPVALNTYLTKII